MFSKKKIEKLQQKLVDMDLKTTNLTKLVGEQQEKIRAYEDMLTCRSDEDVANMLRNVIINACSNMMKNRIVINNGCIQPACDAGTIIDAVKAYKMFVDGKDPQGENNGT